MNFDLSEEQQLLRDSVERFVSDHYELEARRKLASSKLGFSEDHWQTMAELGWLGLTFAEDAGGFGGNQVDAMILFEQFGRGLVLEPYLASAVLAGSILKQCTTDASCADDLQGLINGEQRWALAHAEADTPHDPFANTTRAEPAGTDAYTLSGSKSLVINGASAHHLIVSAGIGDELGLFVLEAEQDTVERHGYPMVDGTQAAELRLHNATARRLDTGGADAADVLNTALTNGLLAVCAEAVGAMGMLYEDTLAYTKERHQFGHALAGFQVVKHRLVDMFVEYEQCRSLLYRATLETAQGAAGSMRSVHALKFLVGKTGIAIGEEAVQLHGGMGMTEELLVAHYFKRLLVIDALFGDGDYHLQRFTRSAA